MRRLRREIARFSGRLARAQKPLNPEAARIIYANLWSLYENIPASEAKPSSAPVMGVAGNDQARGLSFAEALILAAAACLCLSGCALLPQLLQHVPLPSPTQGPSPETPEPTAAQPTPAPTSTPAPTASPTLVTVPSACDNTKPSEYENAVKAAERRYQATHPEMFDGPIFKPGPDQEVYIAGVCAEMPAQLDCLVDASGDMSVALKSTPMGLGFSESYHPISSSRIVQAGGYLERCTPRWFGAVATPDPTATPEPTEFACPAMTAIGANWLNGSRTFPQGNEICRDVDLTPRCSFSACANPANGCPCGFFDSSCEPMQEFSNVMTSANVSEVPNIAWRYRVCGKLGDRFRVIAYPSKYDKGGRVIDRSKFKALPFVAVLG